MNTLQQLHRNLAPEAKANNERRLIEGIYSRYMQGRGLDLGYRGENGTDEMTADKFLKEFDNLKLPR